MHTTIDTRSAVDVRPIAPEDADAVARILFAAFAGIHDHHRFPRDIPSVEVAAELARNFIAHPLIHGVVAEAHGRVVGSNFIDERGPIRGVGPITVDPAVQAAGVGRRLMEAVLERGASARGVRLLQDAFNTASLGLYTSLGFDVREPMVVMGGRPQLELPAGIEARPLTDDDVAGAEELSLRVHGYERTNELRDALQAPVFEPYVALRDGRVTAYAATLAPFGAAHAVAETDDDMRAVIAGAAGATDAPLSFLLPTRQNDLFRSLLGAGLRVVKPMTYMTIGEYREPAGAWIPSVLY